MAFEETPTDHYGMSLLILASDTPREKTNKHHPWHPNADLDEGSDEDRSLRYSVVQRVNKIEHSAYHDRFKGPKILETGKFFRVVLGRAGYIPGELLNVSGKKRTRVPLNPRNRQFIKVFPDTGPKGYDGQDYKTRRTGIYLARYAISQNFGHLGTEIDEFLETKNDDRRLNLGEHIIDEGIRVALDTDAYSFKAAITEHRARMESDIAIDPFKVVRGIFVPKYNPDYLGSLAENLQRAS
jgi:hypothetical protein